MDPRILALFKETLEHVASVLFGLPIASQQASSFKTMTVCIASFLFGNSEDFGGGCSVVWGL